MTRIRSRLRKGCVLALIVVTGLAVFGCGGRKAVTPRSTEDTETRAREDDARRKAEEATRRKGEEERLQAEAARQKAEKDRLAAEEARRKTEEEARRAELALEAVYFDYDKYNLRPDAFEILSRHAKTLGKYSGVSLTVEGHCDERGTVEYNLALGERRAKSARDYLVRYGIDAGRITTVSYGEERPADAQHNQKAWAKNRRDEFAVAKQ